MFSDDSARVGTYDTFYGYGTVGTVGTVRWVQWVRYGGYGTVGTVGAVRWVRTYTLHTIIFEDCTPHRALLLKFDNMNIFWMISEPKP